MLVSIFVMEFPLETVESHREQKKKNKKKPKEHILAIYKTKTYQFLNLNIQSFHDRGIFNHYDEVFSGLKNGTIHRFSSLQN